MTRPLAVSGPGERDSEHPTWQSLRRRPEPIADPDGCTESELSVIDAGFRQASAGMAEQAA